MANKHRSPVFILAGEYRHAKDWLTQHGLSTYAITSKHACVYVYDEYKLQGIKRGFPYVVLDTFWRFNPRASRIFEMIQVRAGIELANSKAIIKIKDNLNAQKA